MELIEFYKPRSLSSKRLDTHLAAGWFRSSNGLFRNKVLCLGGRLCTVVNIRLRLDAHRWSRSQKKLFRRNKDFRVEVAPLNICFDMERLYLQTRQRFKGFIFPDLRAFLYDFFDRGIFNSLHVKVYDGDRLIAASVFDKGEKAIMSVLGLYDPAYSRYSPGIYTMLQEIEFGKENGFRFYYPGYVLDECSEFNYKLSLGKFEFLNEKHRWVKDYDTVVASSEVPLIETKSEALMHTLLHSGIPFQRLMYKLFSLGYAYPKGTFLRNPIIFILPELTDNPFKISIATYDQESDRFKLCHPLPVQDSYLAENQSKEFQDASVYYDMILQDSLEDTHYFDTTDDLISSLQAMLSKRQTRHAIGHLYVGKP